jgi:protein FRA10AC1
MERSRVDQILKSSELLSQDYEILNQYHEFIRDDESDKIKMNKSWEVRMARKYYNTLFKEYALCDLSKYKEGKIGLRWRVEQEVVQGKGQYSCGSITCSDRNNLNCYEVPFRYKEHGIVKHELVKVCVCEDCAIKLFYKHLRENNEEEEEKKKKKRKHLKDEVSRETKKHSKKEVESIPPPLEPSHSVDQTSSSEIQPPQNSTEKNTFGMENYLKDYF